MQKKNAKRYLKCFFRLDGRTDINKTVILSIKYREYNGSHEH